MNISVCFLEKSTQDHHGHLEPMLDLSMAEEGLPPTFCSIQDLRSFSFTTSVLLMLLQNF
ncbi:hypothetical protein DAPPUDRAFT_253426 [Daphnia pulex]|uniref:Uncharacterized protein n=1 Tax=Daphnia pulex TaxID=6669 RepID=E9H4T2_DAPPU|nr:hypothetical protein DAPPUDRAFT_340629 [Daphnia pulex]EFX73302.1 hypothetical protein DAPPUDRAFT_253426 [Daphnia pulex]|eukprot:EFX61114.1 hypothetical protein DAPPUDRAFT_340629 [Daphnia pulex]